MKTTIQNAMANNASFEISAREMGISIGFEDNYRDFQETNATYKSAVRFDENFIAVVKQLGGEVIFDQDKFNTGKEFLASIKFEGVLYEKNVRHYSGWTSDGVTLPTHWIDLTN